ncbi:hypothetical protein FB563_3076 [Streptomyces puniciscabiei]|uniref:Uncharacterized protein n=1 Tax=Streptomyces puniciscabiei TaxID=164348 RepID=A0A542UG78_9ACTN|nr:hypothetical protein [Streptomyces puniciscabiei]TQK98063.1 hypothetical protein FB563_3076 [Streptomyces puniciscabiei]
MAPAGGAPADSRPSESPTAGQRAAAAGEVFPSVTFTAGLSAATFAAAAVAVCWADRRRHRLLEIGTGTVGQAPTTRVPAGTAPAGAETTTR